MAQKQEVVAKVKELIAQSLGVNEDEIVPDASFIDDLGADSLDIVELVMLIEKEFDIAYQGRSGLIASQQRHQEKGPGKSRAPRSGVGPSKVIRLGHRV